MSQLAVYGLCYMTYLHVQGKWRVSFGWLLNTGLRTLWIKYPAFSSFILKPFYPECTEHHVRAPPVFKHLSTFPCSAPGDVVWSCGHEKWTILGNKNSQAASNGGKSNPQGKEKGNQGCGPPKFSERNKTEQYWNMVSTVYRADLTRCQGVKGSEKSELTLSWLPDALILPPIWKTHHFRLLEPKNKYNHPS